MFRQPKGWSFTLTFFGRGHYFWKRWESDRVEDRDKPTNHWRDIWFYWPEDHSSGGTGLALRFLPLGFGVQVSFHWGIS